MYAWKLPDWTCWLYSVPWIAWIFLLKKSRNVCYNNSLKGMLIMQRLFGRWTRWSEVWIGVPCSAIPSPHWTGCRQRAQSFGNNYPPVPSIRTALNPTQAYNMVPGRDPENG